MDSVWYQMGMRSGKFIGTNPATFMNSAYRFFLDLRDQCRKVHYPGYIPPESENKFSFNARDRYGRWRVDYDIIYKYMLTFSTMVPDGNPLPEAVWNSTKPQLKKVNFTEEEILNEEIIPVDKFRGKLADSTEWEAQRYRLIQKMRYCLIPLQIYMCYLENEKEQWYDRTYDYSGHINLKNLYWYRGGLFRIKVKIPDYWNQTGVVCKIGINSDTTKGKPNIKEGEYWLSTPSYTSPELQPDEDGFYETISDLQIYGAVDLASHPDFVKYFDLHEKR